MPGVVPLTHGPPSPKTDPSMPNKSILQPFWSCKLKEAKGPTRSFSFPKNAEQSLVAHSISDSNHESLNHGQPEPQQAIKNPTSSQIPQPHP